ncbi:GNAT family N-acetyltransferase [Filomicrobium insigne]|nr:GNAT family N-acetyltransferase [Filomicrobium insigne]
MSAIIRLTREEDIAALPAIERSSGETFRVIPGLAWIADDNGQSPEEHLHFLRSGTSWVATDEQNRLLGFLNAEVYGQEFHIWQLAVRHHHQRRGCGTALIREVIASAKARKLFAITLTTFRNVPWNMPFYQSLGFQTLRVDQLDDRLIALLRKEVEHGLPETKRCAMRLVLGHPPVNGDTIS